MPTDSVDRVQHPQADYTTVASSASWKSLLELIRTASTVSFSYTTDAEFGGDSFSGTLIPPEGRAIHAVREDLGALVDFLAGGKEQEKRKICMRCESLRPLTSFATMVTAPDGHWRYCKLCECVRNRDHRKKRRQAAASTAPTP